MIRSKVFYHPNDFVTIAAWVEGYPVNNGFKCSVRIESISIDADHNGEDLHFDMRRMEEKVGEYFANQEMGVA